MSSLAPQLELHLHPTQRFLAPLLATAHTVLVHDPDPINMGCDTNAGDDSYPSMDDWDLEEPAGNSPQSVLDAALRAAHHRRSLWRGGNADTVANRQAFRKRIFNRLASQPPVDDSPRFDVGREDTFEFDQHLLVLTNPHDLQLSVASVRIGLSQALNGQPIKVLAAHRDDDDHDASSTGTQITPLWSFDLWHQSLLLNQPPHHQSEQPTSDL